MGIGLNLLIPHLPQQIMLIESLNSELADIVGPAVFSFTHSVEVLRADPAYVADNMPHLFPKRIVPLESSF